MKIYISHNSQILYKRSDSRYNVECSRKAMIYAQLINIVN